MRQILLAATHRGPDRAPAGFGHGLPTKPNILRGTKSIHCEAGSDRVALDYRYSVMTGLLAEGEDKRVLDFS